MNNSEIFMRASECIVRACGTDESLIEKNKILTEDLGIDSIDMLMIVFELENDFGISIKLGELERFARENTEGPFEVNSVITDAGLQTISNLLPEIPMDQLKSGLTVQDIPTLFTVGMLCGIVERKLEETDDRTI